MPRRWHLYDQRGRRKAYLLNPPPRVDGHDDRQFPLNNPHWGRVKGFVNAATLRSRARYWWRKEIRWWLVLGLIIFSIRSSLADWSDLPTGSMKANLLQGDRIDRKSTRLNSSH